MTSDARPVLACDLDALSGDERARRATLASRVTGRFREVRETPDGYAACIDADRELLLDALDWILPERRCCPFLRFELRFESTGGPVWLDLGGGPGVKEFMTAMGLRAS